MSQGEFLSIRGVGKVFHPEGHSDPIRVIEAVSLEINRGEIVVFLGPSGCGKTTLMRIVGGLETQSSGQVLLEGVPVRGPDRRRGMVFQAYSSFPWLTVAQNIAFGLRYQPALDAAERARISQHYLRLVGLADVAHFHPNRISGGMRQRVAIARTLAANPDILLMDEPFGALDAQTREFLQFQLLEINREEHKTTIFVTHDVEEAVLLANRIVVFSARPARILEIIPVDRELPGPRTLETKDSDAFLHLRNRILAITRQEARRAEAPPGGKP